MKILNDFLRVENIVTFIISVLQTVLICIFFPHFCTEDYGNVLIMSYEAMVQAYSLPSDPKWDVS